MKYLSTFNQGLFDAIAHYKAIDPVLAKRFVEAVDQARIHIERFPKSGNQRKNFRSWLIRDFPYRFCYRENLDGELVAITLFHHRQLERSLD